MSAFDDLIPKKEGQGAFDDLVPKRTVGGTLGDIGISALKGAISVPEAGVGLADIVTGGQAGKFVEGLGFEPKRAKQILDTYLSPAQQAANARVEASHGFVDRLGAMVENPSTIGHAAVESLPSMLAGGVAARGLVGAAKVAPWLAGAAGEGLVGAGQAAEQTRQESPTGLLTPEQSGAAVASGIGTGLIGAGAGKLSQKLGIADIDTMIAGGATKATNRSLPRKMIESAASEGVLEELPQSMQEQMWQNVAQNKPLMEGVPEAGASGMVTGAAMGAAGGGYHAVTQHHDAARAVLDDPNAGSLSKAAATGVLSNAIKYEKTPLPEAPPKQELALAQEPPAADPNSIDFEPPGLKTQQQAAGLDNLQQYSSMGKGYQLESVQSFARKLADGGKDYSVIPHEDGGYTLAPTDALSPGIRESIAQLQPGEQAPLLALPSPDSPVPGGEIITDSNGMSRAEQFGDQLRSKRAALEQKRADLGESVPYGPNKRLVPLAESAAAKLATDRSTSTGEPHTVVPHPTIDGKFAVVPASSIIDAPPASTAQGSSADILDAKGKPFRALFAAKRQLAGMPDKANYSIQQVADGFVIRPDKSMEILRAGHEAATSPLNDLPAPTQAQIEAGNYKKGHIKLHGLDVSIENPEGSTRSGVDADGKPWETRMQHHYGYIRGTIGADKDHIDAFIGHSPDSQKVFVVDQVNPKTGEFDEHKVIMGANSLEEARQIYADNYAADWQGGKNVSETSVEGFKAWLKEGDAKRPFAEAGIPTSEQNQEVMAPQAATKAQDQNQLALGIDRRQNVSGRKAVSEMTPDEMRAALLVDDMTGLGNKRAYNESIKKKFQASIDIDSLKWINDNLGHEGGDKLIQAVGQALKEEGIDAYHVSGDEFIAQFDDTGVGAAQLERARDRLKGAVITAVTPDGTTIVKNGAEFSYGIAETLGAADGKLQLDKTGREATGERAGRGAEPAGVVRKPAEGQQNRERATASTQADVSDKPKFSLTDAPSVGMPVQGVKDAVARIAKTWANAPKITVVQSVADLPFAAPRDARGGFHEGQAYLVADNLSSPADAQFVLFHEVLGHAGLRGLFGDNLINEMNALSIKNAGIRMLAADWRAKNQDIRGTRSDENWRALSVEEALADMAGQGKEITGLQKFVARFQEVLRAIGLDKVANWMEKASNAEVMQVLAGARQYIEGGQSHAYTEKEAQIYGRVGGAVFSRAGTVAGAVETLRSGQTFAEAVDNIKSLFASDRRFGIWDRTIGTQFNKATKDADFKRVFDALNRQTEDTAHFAIEAERLAPSVLQRLDSAKDIMKALGQSGSKFTKDLAAVSKALFANIEGKRGVSQKVFTDAELINDFGLGVRQVEMYRQVRAAVDASIDRLAQTTIASMAQSVGMDISGLKNASLEETARAVKDGTDDGVVGKNVPGTTPTKNAELHKRIDDLVKHAGELKAAGYMPAMRFGQYAVTVRDPAGGTDPKFFSMYESQFAANVAARQLASEYPGMKVEKSVMNPDQFAMFKGVSPETVELFAKFSGMDQNEAFKDYVALAKAGRSSMKRMLDRKGIAGFSEDASRVLAQFITSNARQSALNMNGTDISNAMASQELAKKGDVQQEAQKLVDYMQNPREEAQKLRGFLFMNFLGGSVASAATNLTQPILQTTPYLTQYAGAKTAGIMASSARMAATGKILNPELRAAMERAAADGITDPHEIHNLMADASGSTLGTSLRARALTKAWGSFFSLSEAFNRRLTFLAAYQTAMNMGPEALTAKGFKDAYDFAGRAIIETQGLYSKTNRPNWARGAVGASLFTFKQFSISYIEFLNRLPAKQKGIALAILVLAAGLQGLPFAEDVEDLIDTVGQSMGHNTNSKQALRQFAADTLGDVVGPILTHGLSTQTGIDMQGRLGLGNLIPGTAMLKQSEIDKGKDAMEFAGPVGAVVQSFMQAFSKLQDGNVTGKTGALAALAPTALKNALQGAEVAQTGVYKDGKGRKVVDATAGDGVIKALGFQPQTVARESRTIGETMQNVAMVKATEAAISDQWAQGIAEGDGQKVRAAVDKLHAWNVANPDSRIQITPAQIRQRVMQMAMSREQRFVKTVPKEMRGEAMKEIRS